MKEIYTRRSIRNYTGEAISKEVLREVLKAGMNAPSGKNTQPWHFFVVNDGDLIESLLGVSPYWSPLKKAGQGIIVCGDLDISADPYYNFVDASAATQNILLQAEALGYGTCWLGIAPSLEKAQKVRELMNMPKNLLPVNLIAIGVKNEQKEPNDRFLEDRIHYNAYLD